MKKVAMRSGDARDTRTPVLAAVADWAERGWIRRLDAALARFVADRDPALDGTVPFATAMLAHLEGRGHTGLVVEDLLTDPDRLLAWSGEASDALRVVLRTLPARTDDWLAALRACDAVHVDGDLDFGGQPLVLSGRMLYLRRYWTHERRIASQVLLRADTSEPVDEGRARAWLGRLFDPRDDGPDWQKVACAVALRSRIAIVTGGPGTGKTYTAARFIALLFAMAPDPATLRIALAAPTGKAAARLKQSIDGALSSLHERLGDALPLRALAAQVGAARTLHALLGTRVDSRRFRHDASHPLDVDVVLVDETSMIHVEMMDALLDALPPTARIVLLGDKDQLASVEAGAVLGELCRDADAGHYSSETVRYVESTTGERLPAALVDERGGALAQRVVVLRRSQRFGGAIDALARAVNQGDAATVVASIDALPDGPVSARWSGSAAIVTELAERGRPGAVGGYRTYLEVVGARPADGSPEAHERWARDAMAAFDRFRVLCAVREGAWGVAGLNEAIARRLAEAGLLTPGPAWFVGRPVLVTRSDDGLGVRNGDVGIVLPDASRQGALRACFVEGASVRSVSVARLAHVETAFAMTVHKSQGSEYDHTVLVLPPETSPVTTRELVYTGVTRARSAFTLVGSRRDGLAEVLAQTTRRASGLQAFIDG